MFISTVVPFKNLTELESSALHEVLALQVLHHLRRAVPMLGPPYINHIQENYADDTDIIRDKFDGEHLLPCFTRLRGIGLLFNTSRNTHAAELKACSPLGRRRPPCVSKSRRCMSTWLAAGRLRDCVGRGS
eukprot:1672178-Pleurochrysis_carterae.AAC.1